MTKHRVFIALTLVELVAIAGLVARCRVELSRATENVVPAKIQIVEQLGLTDLAIWTEARYTRHPSQADLFSPFQDFPSSLEHFPAGSVVGVPDLSSFRQPSGQ
jgi:hypothetical protein